MFVASVAYVAASFVTFKIIGPVQDLFFPALAGHASLLFLPHGVRVLAGWLLGWRAIVALLPGVFAVFWFVGGADVFLPSRLVAIAIAVATAPATFRLLAALGWNLSPGRNTPPCWPCVMAAGIVISVIIATLTNMAFDTRPVDFVAYLIGDFFGLFFLMMFLMFFFRFMRHHGTA